MAKKTAKSLPAWLVMAGEGVRCQRCGGYVKCPVPMPMDAFQPWCEYVGAHHTHCKDVGRVGVPAASVEEWAESWDVGMSSKAIYRHMKGLPHDPVRGASFPSDPDDFGRCYRLLALAPNWRDRIGEMAKYGPQWTALAGAWDELTAMYEAVIAGGGKMAPDLYRRMNELHSPQAVPA